MAQLREKEAPLLLGGRGHGPVGLEALALEGRVVRDDGVAGGLEVVVLEHDVAGQDDAEAALAPAPVDVDELRRGHAAPLEHLGVPRREALGHGGLHEAVLGGQPAEGELEGLAERRRVDVLGLETVRSHVW